MNVEVAVALFGWFAFGAGFFTAWFINNPPWRKWVTIYVVLIGDRVVGATTTREDALLYVEADYPGLLPDEYRIVRTLLHGDI